MDTDRAASVTYEIKEVKNLRDKELDK